MLLKGGLGMPRIVWAFAISIILHGLAVWCMKTPERMDNLRENLVVDLTFSSAVGSKMERASDTKIDRKNIEALPDKQLKRKENVNANPKTLTQVVQDATELERDYSESLDESACSNESPPKASWSSTTCETPKGEDLGTAGVLMGNPEGSNEKTGEESIVGAGKPKDQPPILIYRVEPDYPNEARFYEGRVILDLLVGLDGGVSDIQVKKSSGHKALDNAAVKAVAKYRYQPAIRHGKAVAERIHIAIRFQLK